MRAQCITLAPCHYVCAACVTRPHACCVPCAPSSLRARSRIANEARNHLQRERPSEGRDLAHERGQAFNHRHHARRGRR
eukprot:8918551-Alexandrium_andersonii.AAC.1